MFAYAIFWNIMFVLIGICAYLADWKYGTRLRARWHNLTHSESERISAEDSAGFIYKRPIKQKLLIAALICLVQSVASVKYAPVNALFELLTSPIEIMMVLLGFYLAPGAYQRWGKRDHLFEWAEGVGSGKFSFRQWLQELIGGLPFIKKRSPKNAEPPPKAAEQAETVSPQPPPTEPEKSPSDLIRDFAERHGGRR